MTSWLDMLPSSERQRIREKFKLSAAEYERLREKVKGPEDLERELRYNEAVAALKFGLETEPVLKESLKKKIESDVAGQGIEGILEVASVNPDVRQAIESGNFDVTVAAPDASGNDQLVVYPEGNVSEKIPVKKSMSDAYVTQFRSDYA